nr:hapless 2 [Macaca nemestrina]
MGNSVLTQRPWAPGPSQAALDLTLKGSKDKCEIQSRRRALGGGLPVHSCACALFSVCRFAHARRRHTALASCASSGHCLLWFPGFGLQWTGIAELAGLDADRQGQHLGGRGAVRGRVRAGRREARAGIPEREPRSRRRWGHRGRAGGGGGGAGEGAAGPGPGPCVSSAAWPRPLLYGEPQGGGSGPREGHPPGFAPRPGPGPVGSRTALVRWRGGDPASRRATAGPPRPLGSRGAEAAESQAGRSWVFGPGARRAWVKSPCVGDLRVWGRGRVPIACRRDVCFGLRAGSGCTEQALHGKIWEDEAYGDV